MILFENMSSPGTVTRTPLTGLCSTDEILGATYLYHDKLPSLIKNFLHTRGHVDYLAGRNHVVITVDIPVKHLFVPKAILRFSVLIEIFDIAFVRNAAFPAQRRYGARVRLH